MMNAFNCFKRDFYRSSIKTLSSLNFLNEYRHPWCKMNTKDINTLPVDSLKGTPLNASTCRGRKRKSRYSRLLPNALLLDFPKRNNPCDSTPQVKRRNCAILCTHGSQDNLRGTPRLSQPYYSEANITRGEVPGDEIDVGLCTPPPLSSSRTFSSHAYYGPCQLAFPCSSLSNSPTSFTGPKQSAWYTDETMDSEEMCYTPLVVDSPRDGISPYNKTTLNSAKYVMNALHRSISIDEGCIEKNAGRITSTWCSTPRKSGRGELYCKTPEAPRRSRRRGQLLNAILDGDCTKVVQAIREGDDPNSPVIVPSWVTGKSCSLLPILLASRLANCEIIQTLIHHGAVPQAVNREGRNALHLLLLNVSQKGATEKDKVHTDEVVRAPQHSSITTTSKLRSEPWKNLEAYFSTLQFPELETTEIYYPLDNESGTPKIKTDLKLTDLTPFFTTSKCCPEPKNDDILACAEILLGQGIDAQKKDVFGETPKDIALKMSHVSLNNSLLLLINNSKRISASPLSKVSVLNQNPYVCNDYVAPRDPLMGIPLTPSSYI